MSVRINSTGRKRLLREHLKIRLLDTAPGEAPAFSAVIDIPPAMNLPPAARVYIEPYVGSSSMRFDFGSVGAPLAIDRCVMSDVDAGAAVLFRIKVVDESAGVGKILAAANGVRPENDADGDDRKPLLPLRLTDLQEEIWRLEIDRDSGPTLCVNNKLPGLAEKLQLDPLLQGAIYPEVTRHLVKFVWGEQSEALDDDSEWRTDWKDWFEQQFNRPIADEEAADEEALSALADEVAAAFAIRMKFASGVANSLAALLEIHNG